MTFCQITALPGPQKLRAFLPGPIDRDTGSAQDGQGIPFDQCGRRFIDTDANVFGRSLDEGKQVRFPAADEKVLVDGRALHEAQTLGMVADGEFRAAGIAPPEERALDAGAGRGAADYAAPREQGVHGCMGTGIEIDFRDAPLAAARKEKAVRLQQRDDF